LLFYGGQGTTAVLAITKTAGVRGPDKARALIRINSLRDFPYGHHLNFPATRCVLVMRSRKVRTMPVSSLYDFWQTEETAVAMPWSNKDGEWRPVSAAPFGRDLALAVIDYDGVHALVFPCRRILGGWVRAKSEERIDVRPTHWREWTQAS
jgi:hypothetical protein